MELTKSERWMVVGTEERRDQSWSLHDAVYTPLWTALKRFVVPVSTILAREIRKAVGLIELQRAKWLISEKMFN